VPIAMGAIVGATSLSTGFFIMGGVIIGVTAIMGVVLARILRNDKDAEEKSS